MAIAMPLGLSVSFQPLLASMSHLRRMSLDVAALALFAACVFVGLSLATFDPADPPSRAAGGIVSNLCGPTGAIFAYHLLAGLGLSAFYLLYELARLDARLLVRTERADGIARLLGGGLSLAGGCAGLALFAPGLGTTTDSGSGGRLGAMLASAMRSEFSSAGSVILIGTLLIAGLILSGNLEVIGLAVRAAFWPLRMLWRVARWLMLAVVRLLRPLGRLFRRGGRRSTPVLAPMTRSEDEDEPATIALPMAQAENLEPEPSSARARVAENVEEEEVEEEAPILRIRAFPDDVEEEDDCEDGDRAEFVAAWEQEEHAASEFLAEERPAEARSIRVNPPAALPAPHASGLLEQSRVPVSHELPDLDLLDDAEEFPYELMAERARVAAEILERTFQEFRLNVHVAEIDTGPVVTQYELRLEKGLKVSKVMALADDLAIALRVAAVRVVWPIPGKNTVGIEVPNETRVMVRLRELIESAPIDPKKYRIPMFLGKDVSGRPLVVDLTTTPHLLIAGRTGTGKSVCLNTLIMSILMTRSPDDVRMLMIDPKMVELSPYKRIPHLMHPVITDMKKAEAVLGWAVDKMEERYEMLARCGVRHLDNYNKLTREERLKRMGISELEEEADSIPDRMPYIVIVADEMADMMMTSGKDVEGHIIRLAQKSRAVGIHLVLATQKPTVDVITGLIKSNLPARISFQVSSRTDSRVVLDAMGAERLLGDGDMLYLAPGTSHLTRAQGTFTSGEETDRIIEFFSDVEPQYSEELVRLNAAATKGASPGASRDRDDMYDQAVEVVVREGRGSTSLLQRALGIGYGRAARLIDYMAEDGIVGDYNGSQAREVLYTLEQWESIRNGVAILG